MKSRIRRDAPTLVELIRSGPMSAQLAHFEGLVASYGNDYRRAYDESSGFALFVVLGALSTEPVPRRAQNDSLEDDMGRWLRARLPYETLPAVVRWSEPERFP